MKYRHLSMKSVVLTIFVLLQGVLSAQEGAEDKPCVIANIYGQLGNNLFQVATAQALAWDHGAEAYFPDFASSSSVYDHVFFRCKRYSPDAEVNFVWNEVQFDYHPIPFQPNMLINGYFQSEKYFASHREQLLQLFAPRAEDLEYMRKKYMFVLGHPYTVGVQIRHYKTDTSLKDLYPQYGKDYLEKAIAYFPESALFVVTSDNMEFARKNMPPVKNVLFIENEPHYIAFYLLSMCKHNIITNSTFGWWAAWLNANPDKKVIYPGKHINGLPTQDVYPANWTKIEALYE